MCWSIACHILPNPKSKSCGHWHSSKRSCRLVAATEHDQCVLSMCAIARQSDDDTHTHKMQGVFNRFSDGCMLAHAHAILPCHIPLHPKHKCANSPMSKSTLCSQSPLYNRSFRFPLAIAASIGSSTMVVHIAQRLAHADRPAVMRRVASYLNIKYKDMILCTNPHLSSVSTEATNARTANIELLGDCKCLHIESTTYNDGVGDMTWVM
jgi:hypothetical protein